MHPLARRRMSLVGDEVPPASMPRGLTATAHPSSSVVRGPAPRRGNGHLIEVAAGSQASLRPRPLPADGTPRHHIVKIGASARVDLLLDDPSDGACPSRSTEIWVGPRARLRIIDRACTSGGSVDLVGVRLAAGATVELISLRSGVARSAVVAVDLGPGASASVTWLQHAERSEAVDFRVRGAGQQARHTLMLSAPVAPGAGGVRLDVAADRSGVPTCDSIQMGAPHDPGLPGWEPALRSIGITTSTGKVELPPIPPSLRPVLRRRAKLTAPR